MISSLVEETPLEWFVSGDVSHNVVVVLYMIATIWQFKWFVSEIAVKVANQITVYQAVIIIHPVGLIDLPLNFYFLKSKMVTQILKLFH